MPDYPLKKKDASPFTEKKNNLSYLALGDSYTIGEGVLPEFSYPAQTRKKLLMYNLNIKGLKIIAKTGWTSGELLDAIGLEDFGGKRFDLVTLLIGVNNQYRGQPIGQYETDLKKLLTFALDMTKTQKNRVTVISIPDWGVTKFGRSGNKKPDLIAKEIDLYNETNQKISFDFGVNYLDVTGNYRKIGGLEKNLVDDGLHPSASVYGQWAVALSEIIHQQFNSKRE
jgi:lysophospholipase L1-like esterase